MQDRMYRGDAHLVEITIKRAGLPVDLTGATIWYTAKEALADADVDAVFQKTVGSGVTILDQVAYKGKAQLKLEAADTEGLDMGTTGFVVLYFDVQVKLLDETSPWTVLLGTLKVERDVTITD